MLFRSSFPRLSSASSRSFLKLSPKAAYNQCSDLLLERKQRCFAESDSSSSSTSSAAFAQLHLSTIPPNQAVRLFSLRNDNNNDNTNFWWQQHKNIIQHSELISSVLRRATSFRTVLTTSEIVLCIRVAIHSFMAGGSNNTSKNSGAALISQFYGFLIDELTARLEHYCSSSSSSSSLENDDNQNSNININNRESETAVLRLSGELLELLETISQNGSSTSSLVKNKKFAQLEASILVYVDEVVLTKMMMKSKDHVDSDDCCTQQQQQQQRQRWMEYLRERLSIGEKQDNETNSSLFLLSAEDSNLTLIKSIFEGFKTIVISNNNDENKEQQQELSSSTRTTLNKNKNHYDESPLLTSLRHVESFLSSSSEDDNTRTSSSGSISSSSPSSYVNRTTFIQQIAASSVAFSSSMGREGDGNDDENINKQNEIQEALVVARSIVALAVWHLKREKLNGDERDLLMKSVLVRHGFLVSQISQKFHHHNQHSSVTSSSRSDNDTTKVLIEEALPNAIAVLMTV